MTKSVQIVTEAVYEFICRYIGERGIAPSQREISDNCFISKGTVSRHLDRLEFQGRITREIGQARSIRLTPDKRGGRHGPQENKG